MDEEENPHDQEIEVITCIFEKSGISTMAKLQLPKEGSKKDFCDIDVLGIHNNVVLLVECAGNETLGSKIKDFYAETSVIEEKFDLLISALIEKHLDFYEKCKKTFEELRSEMLIRKLIVTSKKVDVNQEKEAWKGKLFIWGKEDIEYFKVISDTTYNHCKYEIFHSVEIKPSEITEKKHKKPTTVLYISTGEQDNEKFVLTFPMPVRDMLERSFVLRYYYDPETGFQRLLDKKKLRKMRAYLLNEKKSYPNSIIVVMNQEVAVRGFDAKKLFSSEVSEDIKKLGERTLFSVTVPDRYDAFIVIDGQHRLFSFAQDKYSEFEASGDAEKPRLKHEDEALRKLADELQLVVTAIYFKKPDGKIDEFKAKLFFEINTTQTRIRPEDIIALTAKLNPNDPVSRAHILLTRLNQKGPLLGLIKVTFWQEKKIKITSLIRYGGIKDIFYDKSKTYKIIHSTFEKQTKVPDYADFCYILIANYLFALRETLEKKHKRKETKEMWRDVNLEKYYVTSAVNVGALLRLLRHLLSNKDKVYKISEKIADEIFENEMNKNICNKNLIHLFRKPMKVLVKAFSFTMDEFKTNGYAANRWGQIEADMYHAIQSRHPGTGFGDIKLIKKSLRKT
jgi:DGQHR domain-containing protein